MDEIVARAIARWPNVPAVYGWLSLDRRGNWAIKAERVHNPQIIDFIARNYGRDEGGRWFFQNGPQRVFVRLAYTPLVYRTHNGDGLAFVSHTGRRAEGVKQVRLDEEGALLIETELGPGVVHDQDLPEVLAHLTGPDGTPPDDHAIEQLLTKDVGAAVNPPVRLRTASGQVPLSTIHSHAVPRQFRFDPDPRPAPGEPEC